MRLRQLSAVLALVALIAPVACGSGKPTRRDDPIVSPNPTDPPVAIKRTAVDPKPLSDTITKGLAWLASHQLSTGGWGQGDEAGNLRANEKGTANVADTSMALLAFLRAGNNPRTGKHMNTVQRGLEFVISEIEASDKESLYVSSVRGTRVQSKIGEFADTFAALMMLTEARDSMRDGVANARLDAALKKVVYKVEKNQRANGSWDDKGWAPVLSQALAAKSLNRAAQSGTTVSKQVLDRVEAQAAGDEGESGGAGVEIYGKSAKPSTMRDTAMRKKAKVETMKKEAAKHKPQPLNQSPGSVPTAAEIAAADKDADASVKAAVETERALIARLDDPRFVSGFGNNGGEEFLSYLLISETLVQRGDDDWRKWDAAIGKLVDKVQNEDGSWTGHHCITGRTFCTAAALLVLMGDRTPAPSAVIAS